MLFAKQIQTRGIHKLLVVARASDCVLPSITYMQASDYVLPLIQISPEEEYVFCLNSCAEIEENPA